MLIHRNPENVAYVGVSLNPTNRKKIINFFRNRNGVEGISKDELEKYRRGEKEFMPYPHFKAIIDKYGDDFLDLFVDS
ncbi:MAG: hypothetical protein ACERKY_05405 [Anaerolineales bacterium]